ncbi:MAG: hypothetical protein A2912_01630 [Candidatus Buchananbacteria bacterium RIFCSPLOWO2_01_FULL_40_23b]|uniref:Uncharacterized protein n=1 Tax=Candidatus Buchananbacteria bacterium RIFCSPLOWO2_01_FULL_40_23b TaxID=1797544 RepID=A0A1G1YUZ7_9BACT|nr:MAG: hypothetical protein A2912_01630 [Candidatus Buchananbacteria bacterium RIFCSPLOWO2_01_FULL_40_23b]
MDLIKARFTVILHPEADILTLRQTPITIQHHQILVIPLHTLVTRIQHPEPATRILHQHMEPRLTVLPHTGLLHTVRPATLMGHLRMGLLNMVLLNIIHLAMGLPNTVRLATVLPNTEHPRMALLQKVAKLKELQLPVFVNG